jgi:hypothetical protein
LYENNHFAHRESSGFVVDLYWDPADVSHEFRVEILERGSGYGLVLFPTNGRDAVQAFHHPFAVRPEGTDRPGRVRSGPLTGT